MPNATCVSKSSVTKIIKKECGRLCIDHGLRNSKIISCLRWKTTSTHKGPKPASPPCDLDGQSLRLSLAAERRDEAMPVPDDAQFRTNGFLPRGCHSYGQGPRRRNLLSCKLQAWPVLGIGSLGTDFQGIPVNMSASTQW